MNWEAILWFVLLLLFVFVEAGTVTLVSAWFAVGALAALIVSMIGGEIWLQAAVFFTVSAVLLISLRRIAKKYLTPKLTRTNADALVGATALVTGPVDNINGTGQVKVNGMEWTARSTDGAPIETGTQVTIDRIQGVKLYVTPLEK